MRKTPMSEKSLACGGQPGGLQPPGWQAESQLNNMQRWHKMTAHRAHEADDKTCVPAAMPCTSSVVWHLEASPAVETPGHGNASWLARHPSAASGRMQGPDLHHDVQRLSGRPARRRRRGAARRQARLQLLQQLGQRAMVLARPAEDQATARRERRAASGGPPGLPSYGSDWSKQTRAPRRPRKPQSGNQLCAARFSELVSMRARSPTARAACVTGWRAGSWAPHSGARPAPRRPPADT